MRRRPLALPPHMRSWHARPLKRLALAPQTRASHPTALPRSRLQAYEQELRDSTEYYEWRARMQQHDKEEEASAVERRRIETLLGEEAAKESKLRKHNERVAVAAAVKLQVSEGAAQRRRDEERARLEKEARVLDVHAQRDKPALAIEEIAKANHARASAMREEAERLAAAAAEERRAEDERRLAQGCPSERSNASTVEGCVPPLGATSSSRFAPSS